MAKAAGPSSEQLLELLKRAADELKATRDEAAKSQKDLAAAQKELAAANKELKAERKQLLDERKLREEAEAAALQERTVGGQHPKMRAQLEELQELYQQAKVTLEQTKGELQQSRENLVNEVAAQREIKSALERESQAHSDTRAALEEEQSAHVQTRAELEQEQQGTEAVVQQKTTELEHKMDELRAQQQQLSEQLEHSQNQLGNEHQRVAEHTEALATALAERDTLAARIEAIEAARKTDREIEDAKLKDLEDKHAMESARDQQQVVDAVAGLQAEKEKHQATAQKFLSEKQKARDLEAALQEAKTRVLELESATVAAAEQHAQELTERETMLKTAEEQWNQQRDALQAQLAPLQAQVDVSAQERFYVERKYEELSRELQMTLEQRDEVRRLLDNVQAERQRLERALQQR